jgi:hypothetical protein
LRYAAIGLAVFAAVLEIVQLAYPSGRLLPFATVQGQRIGGSSVAAAKAELDKRYAGASLTVKTDAKEFTVPLADAGVAVDTAKSARDAASYPLWQRILPFSLLVTGALRDTPMQVTYDDSKLSILSARVEAEGHSDAVNASITVKRGKAALVPSIPTKAYPAAAVSTAVKSGGFNPRTVVKVQPKTTPAPLTDPEAEAMLAGVQKMIDPDLVFTLQGKDIKPDRQTRGSWLTFAADAKAERLEIGLNNDAISKYLESIQGDAYKAPGM